MNEIAAPPEHEEAVETPAVKAEPSVESLLTELEQRVRSLESQLAALQDPRHLEERIAERVNVDTRQLEERIAERVNVDTRQLEERIAERVVTRLPPPPPPPPPLALRELAAPSLATAQTAIQSSWALFELVGDARSIFGMLFDRRYPGAWLTRIVAVLLVVAILFSGWWFPFSYIWVIGPYLDKAFDLVLAFGLFLLLAREARRYRAWRDAPPATAWRGY